LGQITLAHRAGHDREKNMSNTYRYRFVSDCPNNGVPIQYNWTLETNSMIQVEDLMTAAGEYSTGYHEQIADALAERFTGRHTLRAHHHGVEIETVRIGGIDAGRLERRVQVGNTVFEKGTRSQLALDAICQLSK
jgi:hypothetical protein